MCVGVCARGYGGRVCGGEYEQVSVSGCVPVWVDGCVVCAWAPVWVYVCGCGCATECAGGV